MNRHRLQIVIVAATALAATPPAYSANWLWSTPDWAADAFIKAGVGLPDDHKASFVVATHVNPFVLFGDFDGDHQTDVAVLIRHLKTSKIGVAVARHSGPVDILGAGGAFGNGGDDFRWLDHWYTYTKAPVSRGADDTDPPSLLGDALWVEKTESASAIIYFTGAKYSWYQQGD